MTPDLEEASGMDTIPAPKMEVVSANMEPFIDPFWNFRFMNSAGFLKKLMNSSHWGKLGGIWESYHV